jgi:UDP-N-acetylmuramyl pentapeptide phosphotransferase/UDP-N-acetylglucosamine-1-phosphate transferase
MNISASLRDFALGRRAKTRALIALFMSGVFGWFAAIGSFNWLTSHDSGDPRQYVGGIWLVAILVSFCVACLGLVVVTLNRNANPVTRSQRIFLGVGGSYVLGVVSAFVFLLFD